MTKGDGGKAGDKRLGPRRRNVMMELRGSRRTDGLTENVAYSTTLPKTNETKRHKITPNTSGSL